MDRGDEKQTEQLLGDVPRRLDGLLVEEVPRQDNAPRGEVHEGDATQGQKEGRHDSRLHLPGEERKPTEG